MKVTIKTELINFEVVDNVAVMDGYLRRNLPEFPTAIKTIMSEFVIAYKEIHQLNLINGRDAKGERKWKY